MTIKAGGIIDAADLITPFCQGVQNTAQTLTTAVYTNISFDGESVDTLGIHDTATNNSRFVIGKKLGWWRIDANIAYNANATGDRRCQITRNGTVINGSLSIVTSPSATFNSASIPGVLVEATTVTDYIEIQGQQSSGGNLATIVSGGFRSRVSLTYVGPS